MWTRKKVFGISTDDGVNEGEGDGRLVTTPRSKPGNTGPHGLREPETALPFGGKVTINRELDNRNGIGLVLFLGT